MTYMYTKAHQLHLNEPVPARINMRRLRWRYIGVPNDRGGYNLTLYVTALKYPAQEFNGAYITTTPPCRLAEDRPEPVIVDTLGERSHWMTWGDMCKYVYPAPDMRYAPARLRDYFYRPRAAGGFAPDVTLYERTGPHAFVPAQPRSRWGGWGARGRIRRGDLAYYVAAFLRGDEGESDIVEYLSDNGVPEHVFDNLPIEVTRGIVYCSCGHYAVDGEQLSHSGEDIACPSCADSYYMAEDDGEYHHEDDLYWSDRREAYFTYDYDAEQDDDDDDDCLYDWGADATRTLAKPEIASSSTGDFTIGMEFECETDDGYDRTALARHVHSSLLPKAMCKADGSLDDATGIEVVFAPMTLESTKKAWRSVEFPSGTTAWNNGNCGMHVHIDSRAFTKLTLAKFMAFWNAKCNAQLIRKVAGRHPSTDGQAESYAATVDMDTSSIVRAMKSSRIGSSRYRCVNVTPLGRAECERLGVNTGDGHHSCYNTVELRIFRASLKAARTLAQLEMAHATVEFARAGSCSGMTAEAFTEWLRRYGQRYPALRAFLGIARASKLRNSESNETRDDVAVAA